MSEFREQQEQDLPQLEAMKEYMEDIPVPPGIDEKIWSGIRAGRQRRRRRTVSRLTAYTACILLIVSAASVRFSPVVAAYVGEIPALRPFVELIHYDKGLELALNNDFMQPVGLSEEQDGMKMTVDGVIADESRIIMFYTLENIDGQKSIVNFQGVRISNAANMSSSYGSAAFDEDWKSRQGTVEFYPEEGAGLPDTLELELKLDKVSGVATSDTVWHFAIPIDKAKFEGMKETYDIAQTVTVEGQKIIFGQMTVYPTRIGIEVDYDPANTKRLFYFDDLRLEDEKGETFGTITNGFSGSTLSENSQVLYFQSNYFRKPKHLYLRASSIRALDKAKREVKVDLARKELLVRPDSQLTLKDVGTSAEDGQGILVFELKNGNPLDQDRMYSLFDGIYKDASGQTFDSNRTATSGNGNEYEYQYFIEKKNYRSPLTLTIQDYPTRIYGDIDLRIK